MVTGAMSVFAVSLLGIAGIFSLKMWEIRRQRRFLPRFRLALDASALYLKDLIFLGEAFLAQLPSLSAYLFLEGLAAGAAWFSRSARKAAESAHRLADLVSHKHNFERRETRSDFLKQVIEYKNGLSTKSGTKKQKTKNVDTNA